MASLPSRQAGTISVPGRVGISADPRNVAWRRRLQRASFKGVHFYVEQQGRSSGRRTVVFEYPKRNMPFTEDMGRHAMRYQMTGYLIQAPSPGQYGPMSSDYNEQRDLLEAALLSDGPGTLQDPYNPQLNLAGYNGTPVMYFCERYSIIEERQKGGFCAIEMSFVEAGLPGNAIEDSFTAQALQTIGAQTLAAAAASANKQQTTANSGNVSDQQRLDDAFKQLAPPTS